MITERSPSYTVDQLVSRAGPPIEEYSVELSDTEDLEGSAWILIAEPPESTNVSAI